MEDKYMTVCLALKQALEKSEASLHMGFNAMQAMSAACCVEVGISYGEYCEMMVCTTVEYKRLFENGSDS